MTISVTITTASVMGTAASIHPVINRYQQTTHKHRECKNQ